MAILYQKNGGYVAYQNSISSGVLADVIYTLAWGPILVFEKLELGMCLFYFAHLVLVTIWFVQSLRFATADKRRGAIIYFVYIVM